MTLPPRALQWAADALGAAVTASAPLTGGRLTGCHRLDLGDGRTVVLRRWTSDVPRDVHEFSAAREARALALVNGSDCPVPQVLALDADAEHCDVPALLISWVAGRQPEVAEVAGLDVEQLAAALAATHAVMPPADLPGFAPWCFRHPLGRPSGTDVPDAWAQLLDAVGEDYPPGPEVLLHGDFHPLNTLWSGTTLAAVIDWPTASRGHPFADVARMTSFLEVVAPGTGTRFAAAYADLTGLVLDPWWEARELLDLLPEDPDDSMDLRLFDGRVADVASRLAR